MNLKLNRAGRRAGKLAQKGFTLIELAIVGIFLGLLAIFAVAMFGSNATSSVKATGLYDAASKISDNWSTLAQSCGISNDITANDLTAATVDSLTSAKHNLSLILGTAIPSSTYAACYASSGIRPLQGVSVGVPGAETVYGYGVTVSTPAANSNQMSVNFAAVPTAIGTPMYNRYSSKTGASTATVLPSAADTDDRQLQFSATTNGAATMKVIRPL